MHWGKLAAVAALALPLPNVCAAEAANEFGVAVIIGNKAYHDDRVPEVDYAHNDADAFYRFVVETLGFSPDNVVDLRDATKARMESAFGSKGNVRGQLWRWAEADGSSDVVVFYSGHGVPGINDGRGYLLPVDANPDTAEINGYPIDVLYENLGKVPHKSVTVFLDACFSGTSGDGGKLIEGASPVYVEADVSGLPGLTVLTAATGKQLASWDTEARHGLFTEHLLDALYGAADADNNGRVSAAETKLYLNRHMTRAARRTYGREQDASLHGDESAVLSFSSAGGWSSRPTLGPPAAFTVIAEQAAAQGMAEHRPAVPGGDGTREGSRTLLERAANRILEDIIEGRAAGEGTRSRTSYQVEASAPYAIKTEMVAHGATPTAHRMSLREASLQMRDWFRDCPECPEMAVVPAGSYRMGSPSWEQGRDDDEGPMHEVTFAAPFALGVYEVTVAEFGRFVDETGYRTDAEREPEEGCWTREFPTRSEWEYTAGRSWRDLEYEIEGDQPVVCVSWNDAKKYAAWLAENTGMPYRLPSESEWEYAARARSETKYHFGNDQAQLCVYGNAADETPLPNGNTWSDKAACRDGAVYPTRVGTYRPNAFGLYDMHGNVWEWTEDCLNYSYAGAPPDGSAWEYGDCAKRVLRGGSWGDGPSFLRAAFRIRVATGFRSDGCGFRVARTLAHES